MSEHVDEYAELLGAYALDAVEPDERERIELHLMACPRCRAEVAEHREVASLLAHFGAPAPSGVWDRIEQELAPPAPPMRLSITSPAAPTASEPVSEAPVADLAEVRRRRSGSGRTVAAVAAVAACLVAALAAVAIGQSRRLDRMEAAMQARTVEGMAADAVADAPVLARLEGTAGEAEAVIDERGQGFLITSDMPAPGDGKVYQLWGKVGGTVLSLGTFGGDAAVVPFSVDPDRLDDVELFAVTEEAWPGVVASDQEPLMAGTV